MSERKVMTPTQRARVAGYASAAKRTKEQQAEYGRRGGNATLDKYGVGHYYRMSLRAHNYNVSLDTDGAK